MVDEEKSLVKSNTSIFAKFKTMLRNIFSSKKYNKPKEYSSQNKENNFSKDIKVKPNENEQRLLRLQESFKKGRVHNIKQDDYKQLLVLYDKQNEKIRKEIEMYKHKTAKILNEMKD